MYSSVVYHFLTNTLFNLDHGIQDYNRCSNDRRSSSNDSLEPLSFKLCINRNPVVYFNDRASLPIPRSVFLSEIGFNNDANQNVILHQRNAELSLLREKLGRNARLLKNTTGFLFIPSLMKITEVTL